MPGQTVLYVTLYTLTFPLDIASIRQFLHQVFTSPRADLRAPVNLFARVPMLPVAKFPSPVVRHAPHREPQYARALGELRVSSQHIRGDFSDNERLPRPHIVLADTHSRTVTLCVDSIRASEIDVFRMRRLRFQDSRSDRRINHLAFLSFVASIGLVKINLRTVA